MQTNGTGGGHQHEASEKRLWPGAFPCRLDTKLCACGAKRWVDDAQDGQEPEGQTGHPVAVHQPGDQPRGQESAKAALRTPPKSVLDGLITCGSCDQPMALDDTQGNQEASYTCRPGLCSELMR